MLHVGAKRKANNYYFMLIHLLTVIKLSWEVLLCELKEVDTSFHNVKYIFGLNPLFIG